ncbi:hypothetical protein D3C87_1059500 [compost metagenome]
MPGINHFIRVEQVWSYNMVGSIKETMDMDMHVINDLFTKTASYLMARHNFHLMQDNQQYNGFMNHLREHLEGRYNVTPDHLIFYFDNLFRIISPALAQITERIITCTTITTDLGEIEGFVFGT